jgi:hypothetical protein
MDLNDASADEIIAKQLIEHLGYFKAKQFISESYRVLNNDGILIIETPDLENSYKSFLNADRMGREKLTQWIQGLETHGMNHVFCFPKELLIETIQSMGFVISKVEHFNIGSYNPALRVIAKKTESQSLEIIAKLRKAAYELGLLTFSNETLSSEYEKMFMDLENLTTDFLDKKTTLVFDKALPMGLQNAKFVNLYFKTLEFENILTDTQFSKNTTKLSNENFRKNILCKILNYPLKPALQSEAFKTALNFVNDALANNFLYGENEKNNEDIFDFNTDFISQKLLNDTSWQYFFIGIKEFKLENSSKAKKYFLVSLKFNRNNPFTWWNLARLEKLEENFPVAQEYFSAALLTFKHNTEFDNLGTYSKKLLPL